LAAVKQEPLRLWPALLSLVHAPPRFMSHKKIYFLSYFSPLRFAGADPYHSFWCGLCLAPPKTYRHCCPLRFLCL